MTPQEAKQVWKLACGFTNQYTPDPDATAMAWVAALAPYGKDEAVEAVTNLGTRPHESGRVPPILPANIIGEVRRLREYRAAHGPVVRGEPPSSVETPQQYLAWLRRENEFAASGVVRAVVEPPRLSPERIRELRRSLQARPLPE